MKIIKLFLVFFLLNTFELVVLRSSSANNDFVVGVATHFAQGKGDVTADLKKIEKAGIVSIRDEAYWNKIEKIKNVRSMPEAHRTYIDESIARDIFPLVVLGYGNHLYDHGGKPISDEAQGAFGAYCSFVVEAFKGRVSWYEVWNEWAGETGKAVPGSVKNYLRLLAHSKERIKKIDPNIKILVGSVTSKGLDNGWMEEFIRGGGLIHADGLSIHPYIHCKRKASPEKWVRWLSDIVDHAKRANGGLDVDIYITEMGWPSDTGKCGVSEKTAGEYLARSFLLAKTIPQIKGMWWYEFRNGGEDRTERQQNFGLVYSDSREKPAYLALKEVIDLVKNGHFIKRVRTVEDDIWVLLFEHKGKEALAVWNEKETMTTEINLNGNVLKLEIGPQPVIKYLNPSE